MRITIASGATGARVIFVPHKESARVTRPRAADKPAAMDLDLDAIARRTPGAPRRPRVVDLPVIVPTLALQADLAGIYMRVVQEWRTLASTIILVTYSSTMGSLRDGFTDAMRISDDLADIRNAEDGAGAQADRLLDLLPPIFLRWAQRVERWHRGKWGAGILTPTGVDISTLIGPEDVRETLETVVARNVALVRSVSDQTRARIADTIFRGFQSRAPARDIARELSDATGFARKRSLNIAIDQTQKLSDDLDTERMRQAGIKEWTWRHSGKVHYRPAHLARNGLVYSFEKPPPDMPGQLPFCGCKKQARLVINGVAL